MPKIQPDNEQKKITIRVPADIHAALVALAKQDQRSLNAEIVVALRAFIEKHPRQQ
jgi:predicted HicB family RNase H-like nuclease